MGDAVGSEATSYLCIAFSALSTGCCLVLLGAYLRHIALRRFASSLAAWRALSDLIFSAQFLVFHSLRVFADYNPATSTASASVFAALSHFSLFASSSWFFVFSLNYYVSVSNPFKQPARFGVHYHIFAWGTSLCTAAVTLFFSEYRPNLELCWTQSTGGFNFLNWFLYFFWQIGFALTSVVIVIYCYRQSTRMEFKQMLQLREFTMRSSLRYIVVFFCHWLLSAVFYSIIMIRAEVHPNDITSTPYSTLMGVMLANVGTVDFLLWCWNEKDKLKEVILKPRTVAESITFNEQARKREQDISDNVREYAIRCMMDGVAKSTRWKVDTKFPVQGTMFQIYSWQTVEFERKTHAIKPACFVNV